MSDVTDKLAITQDILSDLVAFPTVSDQSNLAIIDYISVHLQDMGARIEVLHDETGEKANLFATLGPDTDGGFVLSAHTDVVPVVDQIWATDPFKMELRDARLFGRGTCDMKGFIAACLAMGPDFAAAPLARPLHFAFTYDEETGCFGAQALADTLRMRQMRPAFALIGEPTSMRVIDGHKGCYEYTTHFYGLAGHGSVPDAGVNAVNHAARYVTFLTGLQDQLRGRATDDDRFDPPWSTLNVGALHGGSAHNVIPAQAKVDWDFRPVTQDDAEFVMTELDSFCARTLLPEMQKTFPDAAIHRETIAEVGGLIPTVQNPARDLIMELTGANTSDTVAFNTEAGIFQSLGLSAVVCGPGSIEQAHKADEFISLDQLAKCLTMLDRLAAHLHGSAN